MLLFMDGFDHYATADIGKKWSTVGATVLIQPTGGRRGGGCMRHTSSSPGVKKNIPATSGFVIGFSFNPSSLSNQVSIAAFFDGGVEQCSLLLNTDGTISVVRGTATAVTGGTSSNAIGTGTARYIEWKVTISNSIAADSCRVLVDGSEWINVTAGQDLQATANSTANQYRLGPSATVSTRSYDFDDHYLCDQSTEHCNDFLGDCRIDTEPPDGDGFYQQGTPTPSGTHFTCVDDATPNTTDYVDLGTTGHRDLYTFADLPHLASQIVYGVQVNPCVSKDDAGARSVGVTARSGSTDSDAGDTGLSTTPAYYSSIFETDPATGVAWTESGVNSAQFGPKCTL